MAPKDAALNVANSADVVATGWQHLWQVWMMTFTGALTRFCEQLTCQAVGVQKMLGSDAHVLRCDDDVIYPWERVGCHGWADLEGVLQLQELADKL